MESCRVSTSEGISFLRDREDRIRVLREKQNEEREKKILELAKQAENAQKFRIEQELGKRKKIEELKAKEQQRLSQVSERKKALEEAEQERREAVIRRNKEREARLETKRRNERSSLVFAFGSCTPRMLSTAPGTGILSERAIPSAEPNPHFIRRFGGHAENGGGIGEKKRALSASGLDRKHASDSRSTSMYEVFQWEDPAPPPTSWEKGQKTEDGAAAARYADCPHSSASPAYCVARSPPDLRDSSFTPPNRLRPSGWPQPFLCPDGGHKDRDFSTSYLSTPIDDVMTQSFTAGVPVGRGRRKTDIHPLTPTGSGGGATRAVASSVKGTMSSSGRACSMGRLDRSTLLSSRTRPGVAACKSKQGIVDQTVTGPKNAVSLMHLAERSNRTEQLRLRLRHFEKTEVDQQSVSRFAGSRLSSANASAASSTPSGSLSVAIRQNSAKKSRPLSIAGTVPDVPPRTSHAGRVAPTTRAPAVLRREAEKVAKELPSKEKNRKPAKLAQAASQPEEEPAKDKSGGGDGGGGGESVAAPTSAVSTAPIVEDTTAQGDTLKEMMVVTAATVREEETECKKRIATEEEAKAAIAEKRRQARQQAEKEAAEQKRLEEQERRREEEERLQFEREMEMQRQHEEERLRQAIEEAQRKEEEQRAQREEEARLRAEKEEADRKALEVAEQLRKENEEKLRKEEEERLARKQRVAAIMSRARSRTTATAASETAQQQDEAAELMSPLEQAPSELAEGEQQQQQPMLNGQANGLIQASSSPPLVSFPEPITIPGDKLRPRDENGVGLDSTSSLC